jgi:hypothetical protein
VILAHSELEAMYAYLGMVLQGEMIQALFTGLKPLVFLLLVIGIVWSIGSMMVRGRAQSILLYLVLAVASLVLLKQTMVADSQALITGNSGSSIAQANTGARVNTVFFAVVRAYDAVLSSLMKILDRGFGKNVAFETAPIERRCRAAVACKTVRETETNVAARVPVAGTDFELEARLRLWARKRRPSRGACFDIGLGHDRAIDALSGRQRSGDIEIVLECRAANETAQILIETELRGNRGQPRVHGLVLADRRKIGPLRATVVLADLWAAFRYRHVRPLRTGFAIGQPPGGIRRHHRRAQSADECECGANPDTHDDRFLSSMRKI